MSGAQEAVQTQHCQHCWNNCTRSLDKKCLFVTHQSLNSSNINVSSPLITDWWMKCFREVAHGPAACRNTMILSWKFLFLGSWGGKGILREQLDFGSHIQIVMNTNMEAALCYNRIWFFFCAWCSKCVLKDLYLSPVWGKGKLVGLLLLSAFFLFPSFLFCDFHCCMIWFPV